MNVQESMKLKLIALVSIISWFWGSFFSVSAEEFGNKLESILWLVQLSQSFEYQTIESLCLFDWRVPCLQMLFDNIKIRWQVLKIFYWYTALDQVYEDCVSVFACGNKTMKQIAQS